MYMSLALTRVTFKKTLHNLTSKDGAFKNQDCVHGTFQPVCDCYFLGPDVIASQCF